jgi:hypothetical protein
LRWWDTVDWPTPDASTISPTLIGRFCVASNDTSWTRVGSARALNHPAKRSALSRSSMSTFIDHRR